MGTDPTIIICLATSPHGKVVAREGARFAQVLGIKPVFLNVGADAPERRQALEELIGASGGDESISAPLLIRSGDPYSVISAVAGEQRAQMIILGALNRDPAWTRVWGSVARKIARRSRCSVLLLSNSITHRAGDRIVAGIALDAKSAATMPMILRIARQGASGLIHFVHEFSPKTTSVDEDAAEVLQTEDDASVSRQRVEQHRLADFLSAYDLDGLNVRMAALPGREGMQVVEYAKKQHADLIILPAPQRRLTIWDRFFRHPLESVLLDLPCALLLQRPLEDFPGTDTPISDLREAQEP